MATGEGKTLVSTLPLPEYIGRWRVHIVTVNDYLTAKRDSEWNGTILNGWALPLIVSISTNQTTTCRRQAYNADITYGTNNEFGFDYLG